MSQTAQFTHKLIDENRGTEKPCKSLEEAEERKQEMIELGADESDLRIESLDDAEPDGGTNGETPEFEGRDEPDEEPDEVLDTHTVADRQVDNTHREIHRYDDPIPNLPSWMKEEVKEHGGMDLNKDGCQVIANALDFEVSAEADVKAHETDFEYACYTATVTRPDGRTYTAVGDCHIEEQHKEKKDLNRMAETRAKKRAVKWATAGGIEPFVPEANDAGE